MSERISSIPFSWSVLRSERWKECPRGYFYHYYGASGGHDEFATEEKRKTHLFRSLLSEEEYAGIIWQETLRKFFYEDLPVSGLTGFLLRRLHRDLTLMLTEAPRADHKVPLLTELYYHDDSPQEILARRETAFKAWSKALVTCGIFEKIQHYPVSERKVFPSPLCIQIGNLDCYFSPMLVFFHNGELHFLESGTSAPEVRGTLHCFAGNEIWKIPPNRIRSERLNRTSGAIEPLRPETGLNLSATMTEILSDADHMKMLPGPDGSVEESDFPRTTDPAHCRRCRFRELCRVF